MRKKSYALAAVCIMAALWVALCGCDDLGDYTDVEEYYGTFGDIVLIEGRTKEENSYSVEEYFYNEASREDFLKGEDGAYNGIAHSYFVYMAIPFENSIEVDSFALYIQANSDLTLYINVYAVDKIPSNWRPVTDGKPEDGTGDGADDGSDTEGSDEEAYDDPAPETRLGEVIVHLKKDNWDSFAVESFIIDGQPKGSIKIEDGQYLLLQFRNNSGVRIFDNEAGVFVDPQTGKELQRAEITMTNMLVRSLNTDSENEAQGGES